MPHLKLAGSECYLNICEDEIVLWSLRTDESQCGKGQASALLKFVAHISDQLCKPVRLGVGAWSHEKLSQENLVKFYKKRGYKMVRGSQRLREVRKRTENSYVTVGYTHHTFAYMVRQPHHVALLEDKRENKG